MQGETTRTTRTGPSKKSPNKTEHATVWSPAVVVSMYWFSVTLSFGVLELASWDGLRAVFVRLGGRPPSPPEVYRIGPEASGKRPAALVDAPPAGASGPRTALGSHLCVALSSAQAS